MFWPSWSVELRLVLVGYRYYLGITAFRKSLKVCLCWSNLCFRKSALILITKDTKKQNGHRRMTLPILATIFFLHQYEVSIILPLPLSSILQLVPTSVFLLPTHKKSVAAALNSLTSFQAKVLPFPWKKPQKEMAEFPLEASYRQFQETLSHGSLQEISGLYMAL